MSTSFPIPGPFTSEAVDLKRDEKKRVDSPPSFFFAQTQALKLAAGYFNKRRLRPGAAGRVAAKHRQRIRGALFGQVMAAFEFCLKDYIAQVVDITDMYDDLILGSKWIVVDKSRLLASRESTGSVGGLLIHPLPGWHDAATVNERFEQLFNHPLLVGDEHLTLDRLWILRHSVVHNAGFVTQHDAYRLRAPRLGEQSANIDLAFLSDTVDFLRAIVRRLHDPIGRGIIQRWLSTRATGVWEEDEPVYSKLYMLTSVVRSRPRALRTADRERYERDLAEVTS